MKRRMRRIAVWMLAALLWSPASVVSALEPPAQGRANTGTLIAGKFGRGLLNISTGWMEIFYRIERTWSEHGPAAALTGGLLEGVGRTAVRAVVGVYETATAPVPAPAEYQPILKDPVYFLSPQ